MKDKRQIIKLNLLLGIFFSLTLASYAKNSGDVYMSEALSDRSISLIANNLSQKLKADLAESNLNIKFGNVEETKIDGNLVEVKGEAFCVLPTENTQLPINFEAKVDTAKQLVADVQYAFVESAYAPVAEEEILMQELMKQISRDYKTDQITIAIDGFETLDAAGNQKNLKGIGEVKIGEVEWNKINFDVVLGADKKAKKITYNIK
jgi:hypothetical protein